MLQTHPIWILDLRETHYRWDFTFSPCVPLLVGGKAEDFDGQLQSPVKILDQ